MPQTRESALYAQRLILEYNRARKLLRKYFKKRHDPDEARAKIKEIIDNMAARQSKVIGYTLNDAFRKGAKDGNKEINNATISAAANVEFDLSKISDSHLHKITAKTIGDIGKYNTQLSKQLALQYDTLLVDNALMIKLAEIGWSPSIEKALQKRGISPEVISLAKNQTTVSKIINILELQGIHGGRHPREVAKLLQPHISNYFGGGGVVIDNVGKTKRVLQVAADGDYKWVQKKITRVYKATPKSYSNLLARSSMVTGHQEGRYQTLQASKLVDHYISVSILDANTCSTCAMMHGRQISHADGPLYHPNGHCSLKPVFKKDSGLKNKDLVFYEKQSDKWFFKQNDLKEFNKNMPKGEKLKFSSLLPANAITETLPGEEAMLEIRKGILK